MLYNGKMYVAFEDVRKTFDTRMLMVEIHALCKNRIVDKMSQSINVLLG